MSRSIDPWNLIESRRFIEAIDAYSRLIQRDKSPPNYANRAMAHLRLGDYDSALADLFTAEALSSERSTGHRESIGVAFWLANRFHSAMGIWHDLVLDLEAGKIAYTDGAGGVEPGCLLWFAAVTLNQTELLQPARRLFRSRAGKIGRCTHITNWPGPIAGYLLAEFGDEELRSKVSVVPILRERELCQVEFYIGVKLAEGGDIEAARRHYRKAASLQLGMIENEYDLAQREGRRRKSVSSLGR